MTKPSLIPGGVTVEGELSGRGDLVVLGRVLGPITVDGLLIIEEGGAVRGDVRASSVVVRGALAGDAIGQESVRVESGARVVGDLRAPRVKVGDGAHVKGRVQIGAEAGVSVRKPAEAVPGPRVRRVRPSVLAATPSPAAQPTSAPAPTVVAVAAAPAPAPVAAPAPAPAAAAAFTRPPLTMPRLTRVAALRR